jgi:hypothetical protein
MRKKAEEVLTHMPGIDLARLLVSEAMQHSYPPGAALKRNEFQKNVGAAGLLMYHG